jgi:hypothetical protein
MNASGSSILDMSSFDQNTYTNKEAIAISQDPRGLQGSVVWQDCPEISPLKVPQCAQVWTKPLAVQGSFAMAFVNFAEDELAPPRTVSCEGACMESACGYACSGDAFKIRDVWQKTEQVGARVQAVLASGESALFVVTSVHSPGAAKLATKAGAALQSQ